MTGSLLALIGDAQRAQDHPPAPARRLPVVRVLRRTPAPSPPSPLEKRSAPESRRTRPSGGGHRHEVERIRDTAVPTSWGAGGFVSHPVPSVPRLTKSHEARRSLPLNPGSGGPLAHFLPPRCGRPWEVLDQSGRGRHLGPGSRLRAGERLCPASSGCLFRLKDSMSCRRIEARKPDFPLFDPSFTRT
jgi:hypothetical protein